MTAAPASNPHAGHLFSPVPVAADFRATAPFRRGLHRDKMTRRNPCRPPHPGSRIHDPPLAAPSGPAGRPPGAGLLAPRRRSAAPPQPDLSEFRTVDTAVTTRISRAAPETTQPAYLGVNLDADKNGRAVVSQVDPNSPAAAAGLAVGDLLTELDGKPVAGPASVRDLLTGKAPGDSVKVVVVRTDKKDEKQVKTVETNVALAAVSRPMAAAGGPSWASAWPPATPTAPTSIR